MVGEDVGDVEPTGDLDIHTGGDVGLRVEIYHESPNSPRKSRGGES